MYHLGDPGTMPEPSLYPIYARRMLEREAERRQETRDALVELQCQKVIDALAHVRVAASPRDLLSAVGQLAAQADRVVGALETVAVTWRSEDMEDPADACPEHDE